MLLDIALSKALLDHCLPLPFNVVLNQSLIGLPYLHTEHLDGIFPFIIGQQLLIGHPLPADWALSGYFQHW
jgi:hypothetical protein